MANIALTDDHVLLRNGLASLVKNLGHTVLFEADNGMDFIKKLHTNPLPDIVLMDINMPEMDGCETARWIKQHHPGIMVLALSMYNDENSIIRMLKCGAKGYILKDSHPQQLDAAIKALIKEGFHYSELLNGKLIYAFNKLGDEKSELSIINQLNERDIDFLKLVCTEFTYKEIADKLNVSPRTIDNYRDALFEKLHLKTRVGLVMYAVKNGIIRF